MKIAIYARVSTKDKGQDTENQLRELRQFAEASGWTIYKEYIDHASGKNGERDELKAVMDDASKRRFKGLLVWALDRLTREGIEQTFAYVRKLNEAGVQFISFTEAHFRTDGPAGSLMLAVAAWIAEQERRRISERTRAGLARVKAAGVRLGRKPREVDTERARALLAGGLSYRKTARCLGIAVSLLHRSVNKDK